MYSQYIGLNWLLNFFYQKTEFFDWQEALPLKTPAIFAANHPTNLDPIIIAPHMKRKLTKPAFFLAMHKVGRVLGEEMTYKWFWTIVVNQTKRHECLEKMLYILNRGYNLIIFPKGHLDQGQALSIQSTQKGLAWLAHLTGLPVYPIGIYVKECKKAKDYLERIFNEPVIRFKAGRSLYFKKYEKRIPKKVILNTTETIIEKINQLVQEIRPC